MPRIDPRAVQLQMTRRNFLFKHQLANALGIGYERLTAMLVEGEVEVEQAIVDRLCQVLECDAGTLLADPADAR